jgi:hypothetical protein
MRTMIAVLCIYLVADIINTIAISNLQIRVQVMERKLSYLVGASRKQ